jgi:sulfoxide reductase heme-binding subunit YedZ
VYLVAVLAVLHFFWMRAGKRNFAEVAVYATVLAALLAWRVREALRRRASRPGTGR